MKLPAHHRAAAKGFTLLEVMIAVGIFFAGVFAILGLVSTSLGNARRLEHPTVNADVIAAELSITNKLNEGTYSGSLADVLGKDYSAYNYEYEIVEERTNKLFNVDVKVMNNGSRDPISEIHLLLYRPQSDAGSLDGGNFIHK